jgi:hypothetical protein
MMNKKARAVFRVVIAIVMVMFALGGVFQTILLLR